MNVDDLNEETYHRNTFLCVHTLDFEISSSLLTSFISAFALDVGGGSSEEVIKSTSAVMMVDTRVNHGMMATRRTVGQEKCERVFIH